MARLSPNTVKALARELYNYDFSDEAAAAVAHMIGAISSYTRRLEELDLPGIQPPFGYTTLVAEATRLAKLD
jgi:hypothetical protein